MLTTKDVRLQGYPPFELILSHFDALPILVRACKTHCPAHVLASWDAARNAAGPERYLLPATKEAVKLLEGAE